MIHEMNYADGKRRLVVRVDHELDRDELIYTLANHALIHPKVKHGPIPAKDKAEEMVWSELDRRGRTSALAPASGPTATRKLAMLWAEAVVAKHWPRVTV